jgi:hypothetical protein
LTPDENTSPQPATVERSRVLQKLELHGCEVDQLRWKLGMAAAAQEKAEREADRCKQQVQLKEEEVREMLGRQIRKAEEEAQGVKQQHKVSQSLPSQCGNISPPACHVNAGAAHSRAGRACGGGGQVGREGGAVGSRGGPVARDTGVP